MFLTPEIGVAFLLLLAVVLNTVLHRASVTQTYLTLVVKTGMLLETRG